MRFAILRVLIALSVSALGCGGDDASLLGSGEDVGIAADSAADEGTRADSTDDDGGPGLPDSAGEPQLGDAARMDFGADAGADTEDGGGMGDAGSGRPDLSPTPDAGAPDEGTTPPDAGPSGTTDYPLPEIPANCALRAKVVTYNPNGWSHLLDAFEANPTPCADYFIFLPAIAGNKTTPRGGDAPAGVRARAGRFHAVAEFHWGAWSNVGGMTWYQKGVEFRRRMDAAGYKVGRGDTWAINELPSSVRTDTQTRTNVRQLVKGLYDGPSGARSRGGAVFVVGMGMGTSNHSVYKPALKDWLSDDAFWNDMDANVLWWGQETYTSPASTCVVGAQIGTKALRVNEFVEHPARLAAAGGANSARARAFFNQAYVPTLTAVWHSDVYGDTQIGLDAMKKLASLQIYAVRAWAGSHLYPDGRIALAWDNNSPNSTVQQRQELAARIAAAIAGAYAPDGTASRACSPSGAFTWCGCEVAGATFNTTWDRYDSW